MVCRPRFCNPKGGADLLRAGACNPRKDLLPLSDNNPAISSDMLDGNSGSRWNSSERLRTSASMPQRAARTRRSLARYKSDRRANLKSRIPPGEIHEVALLAAAHGET